MKPLDQTFGLEDRPPVHITFLLGLQHICIIAIGLVFPVLLVRVMGGSEEQSRFMVSMSMLAGGIGVIAQGMRKTPVGSGYLCPTVCGPSFLTASILCVKIGGLPLVLGMTMFAGATEALFSRILNRIRMLFPPEITGVIVVMVALSVIRVAGINLLGIREGLPDTDSAVAGIITLGVMIGLNVWTKGNIKLFCILIGMMFGYGLSFAMGVMPHDELKVIGQAPVVWFPFKHHPGFAFSWALVLPMVIAMICSSLKSIGDLTTCQKINDTTWVRPDMGNLKRGILADGIGCFAAGLFGGMGQSTSSANIGLSIATGATSRIIAFSIGGLLILFSFCPKLSAVFSVMPEPVIGAALIFALSFMVIAGLQIIMSRMIDARKTFVIGISIIFGLMVDLMPQAFSGLPEDIQPLFASSLSASTLLAVLLNLIFRIGIKSRATVDLTCDGRTSEVIFSFLENHGRAWAARPEIIKKACAAANEYAELIFLNTPGIPLHLEARFDELNLELFLSHPGPGPQVPEKAPSAKKLLHDMESLKALGGFLVRSYTDTLRVESRDGRTRTFMNFEH